MLIPAPTEAARDAPGRWTIEGRPDMAMVDGGGALRLASGAAPARLTRPVDSPLLASPFLRWTWNVEEAGAPLHPVRIALEFRLDGERRTRALRIAWGASALARGSVMARAPDDDAPILVARGGIENTGRWLHEGVDLSELYARLWPEDDPGRVRVSRVGFAIDAAPRASARFLGLALTR